MKKVFVLAFCLAAISAFAGKVEKRFTFSNYSIRSIGAYHTIQFDNTMLAGLTGEPVLPYHQISLILPPGEKAISIEVRGEALTPVAGSYSLYPHQYNLPLSVGPDGQFVKKEEVYALDQRYPTTPAGNLMTGYLNGYAFALTTFTPVVYNPAKKEVSYYREVVVTIHTEGSTESKEALRLLSSSTSVMKRVKILAQNPEMINLYPKVTAPNSAYQVLIITPAQFQAGYQPLVNFYNTRGVTAQVKTIEEISNLMAGADLQEKIRAFITSEYTSSGIEHVTLGGDIAQVPYRGFYCYVISGSGYEDYNIPADIYFSALDGNWNNNGNNKWGEPGEDDLLPELSVGRMSFSNSTEQANMVNKTINYQQNPGSWQMNKPFLVSEFLYDPPMTWGSDYLELLIDDHNDNGYFTYGIPSALNTVTRLYDTIGFNWGVGQLLNQINAGQSFIHHCGHSNYNYMMRLSNWDITNANFSQVNGVDQNFQLMYTHGCICGAFDENDCIAEKATTLENWLAGGVFNSRYGWFNQGTTEGPSAHIHREFISAIYHSNPDSVFAEIGMAHTISKIKTAPWVGLPGEFEPGAQRWCMYDCNVLGDPAMKVWKDNSTVGVAAQFPAQEVFLSPNPCSDFLNISISGTGTLDCRITLLNSVGQTVRTFDRTKETSQAPIKIDVSGLQPGIYFCQLSFNGNNLTKKFVVSY